MKIVVRKNGVAKAVIITFETKAENFDSAYDRNKFFRDLHGWNQSVPHGQKVYRYRRQGLLDEIPHVKIADSAFMVMEEHMRQMQDFFDRWEEKVEFEMMEVMLEQQKLLKKFVMKEEIEE